MFKLNDFRVGEKIKHISSPGIFTISKLSIRTCGRDIIWVNEWNGQKYCSYDYIEHWIKITPYQLEFSFMRE